MRSLVNFLALAVLAGAYNSAAYAGSSCNGKVEELGIELTTGTVFLSGAGLDHARICSVSAVYGGVNPEVCKATYGKLLAAKTSSQAISLSFHGTGDCSNRTNFPAWGAPQVQIYYLQ